MRGAPRSVDPRSGLHLLAGAWRPTRYAARLPVAADACSAAAAARSAWSAACSSRHLRALRPPALLGLWLPPSAASTRSLASLWSAEDEGNSSDGGGEESEDEAEWMRKLIAGKLSKGDKLMAVDHAAIQYPPFRWVGTAGGWGACGEGCRVAAGGAALALRAVPPAERTAGQRRIRCGPCRRNFYIEVPELARMSEEEVAAYRRQLDGVKVRGKHVPKPVKNWNQARAAAGLAAVWFLDGCVGGRGGARGRLLQRLSKAGRAALSKRQRRWWLRRSHTSYVGWPPPVRPLPWHSAHPPTHPPVSTCLLQCGLSTRILEVLRKGGFERPLSIQAQALPGMFGGWWQGCGREGDLRRPRSRARCIAPPLDHPASPLHTLLCRLSPLVPHRHPPATHVCLLAILLLLANVGRKAKRD